jgi:hypothetical protein
LTFNYNVKPILLTLVWLLWVIFVALPSLSSGFSALLRLNAFQKGIVDTNYSRETAIAMNRLYVDNSDKFRFQRIVTTRRSIVCKRQRAQS